MINLRLLFILLFIGVLALSCISSKKKIRSEQTPAPEIVASAIQENKVSQDSLSPIAIQKLTSTVNDTIIGVIYVSGNEPFTHLMLSVTGEKPFLAEADSSIKAQLWQLQGKKVSIIGIKKTGLMGTIIKISSFRQSQ